MTSKAFARWSVSGFLAGFGTPSSLRTADQLLRSTIAVRKMPAPEFVAIAVPDFTCGCRPTASQMAAQMAMMMTAEALPTSMRFRQRI